LPSASPGGSGSFVLRYRNRAGASRQYTIGDACAWNFTAALEEAKELQRRIDRDEADPLAEKEAEQRAKTVGAMWVEFEKHK
jgi:hypothetical protein